MHECNSAFIAAIHCYTEDVMKCMGYGPRLLYQIRLRMFDDRGPACATSAYVALDAYIYFNYCPSERA